MKKIVQVHGRKWAVDAKEWEKFLVHEKDFITLQSIQLH